MPILEYEIGGNEVKIEGSEAIANIPDNRSMIVEHLTSDDPVKPEAAYGLKTIEEVFAHFMPNIDIEFETEDGQPVEENLTFKNVGDFNIKNMTQQSNFLKKLSHEKNFYEKVIKQLRSNKVLQRALQDPETKAAFIAALTAAKQEMELQ
jgi:hypothetical protein